MQNLYIVLLGLGVVVLFVSLLLGELDSDHSGAFLLSPLSIATGLVAFGAAGFTTYESLNFLSLMPASGGFIAAYALTIALKRYLVSQESNSHSGLSSFVGLEAVVTSAYGNWCMIESIDLTGVRVNRKAFNSHPGSLNRNDKVVIHSIENEELYVAPLNA